MNYKKCMWNNTCKTCSDYLFCKDEVLTKKKKTNKKRKKKAGDGYEFRQVHKNLIIDFVK